MSDTQQKNAPGKLQTFKDRLFSTVILLAFLGGAVLWNNIWGYRILVCVFCALTAWEWGDMLRRSGKPSQPWLTVVAGVTYPLVLIWILARADSSSSPFGPLVASLGLLQVAIAFPVLLTIIAFIWEMRREVVGSNPLRSVGATLVSFVYPGWMFAFILFAMIDKQFIFPVLWIVIITKFSDLFAYVSGVLMGGKIWKENKLIPHISPKKTWEGLLGSLVLTTCAGFLLEPLLAKGNLVFPAWLLLVYIIVIFFLAVFGDLAGSLIKRSLEIKDSGKTLPGIGGFFDLIDSLAFTIPSAFFLIWIFNISVH